MMMQQKNSTSDPENQASTAAPSPDGNIADWEFIFAILAIPTETLSAEAKNLLAVEVRHAGCGRSNCRARNKTLARETGLSEWSVCYLNRRLVGAGWLTRPESASKFTSTRKLEVGPKTREWVACYQNLHLVRKAPGEKVHLPAAQVSVVSAPSDGSLGVERAPSEESTVHLVTGHEAPSESATPMNSSGMQTLNPGGGEAPPISSSTPQIRGEEDPIMQCLIERARSIGGHDLVECVAGCSFDPAVVKYALKEMDRTHKASPSYFTAICADKAANGLPARNGKPRRPDEALPFNPACYQTWVARPAITGPEPSTSFGKNFNPPASADPNGAVHAALFGAKEQARIAAGGA